jgi:CheY-like chemotaxis protein
VRSITQDEELTDQMKQYEEETGKKAIWHGNITTSFLKWQKGEKIYLDNKERISILVSEEVKKNWQKFAVDNDMQTISNLLRKSVNFYMNLKSKKFDFENISNITHLLKEPLTSIRGFSEILIENHKHELSWEVLLKIKSIFDESLILEERIESLVLDEVTDKDYFDILIVDDDLSTISLLTSFFENKGYKCVSAIDGETTLGLLEKYSPKLVLLDIILPDISGYEICERIKSDKHKAKIPIYYITAVPPSEVKEKVKITRAEGYFLKPFKMTDFIELFKIL